MRLEWGLKCEGTSETVKGTVECDPFRAEAPCAAHAVDVGLHILGGVIVGRACGTCVWDVRVGRACGTCVWDMRVGRACGTCVWDVRVGRACGPS